MMRFPVYAAASRLITFPSVAIRVLQASWSGLRVTGSAPPARGPEFLVLVHFISPKGSETASNKSLGRVGQGPVTSDTTPRPIRPGGPGLRFVIPILETDPLHVRFCLRCFKRSPNLF